MVTNLEFSASKTNVEESGSENEEVNEEPASKKTKKVKANDSAEIEIDQDQSAEPSCEKPILKSSLPLS